MPVKARPPHERVLSHIAKVVRVERLGECWEYTGYRRRFGHCEIIIPLPSGKKVTRYGHRVVYEGLVGPIPAGLDLLHACDNAACVRPDHLTPGDEADNMHDAHVKGRMPRGETHALAVFTNAQALEIIRMHEGGMTVKGIAERLGRPRTSVHNIVSGFTYGHVTGRKHPKARTKVERRGGASALTTPEAIEELWDSWFPSAPKSAEAS